MDNNQQLAKVVCQTVRTIMKNTLNLEEFSYREKGRDDPRYRTFKKHLMEFTYTNLRELFSELESWGLIKSTEDGEDVKDGYRDSLSGGSSFVNSEDFQVWLNDGQNNI